MQRLYWVRAGEPRNCFPVQLHIILHPCGDSYLSPCYIQSKHPVAFLYFLWGQKEQTSHNQRQPGWEISEVGCTGVRCTTRVYARCTWLLFLLYEVIDSCRAAVNHMFQLPKLSLSLSLSLSSLDVCGQRRLSGRKDVMGGGLIGQDSSQGSPLINTIWVRRRHSSCAFSSQSDNLPLDECECSSNPFKAGWDKLTSLWPLRANHDSRLFFSHRLTYYSACRLYLVLKMVVNLLHSEVRLCFELLV